MNLRRLARSIRDGWALIRALMAALLLAALTAGVAAADGAWLDTAPPRWNNPGGWVPDAPSGINLDRCGKDERSPAADEESQVAAANWRLQDYWPMQANGKVSVVMATASYDGMCRPWLFNVFVFYDHRYAGTLSPAPMNSREDGVLNRTPVIEADGRVTAQFTRYAPTDPLCCPSRGVTTVTYRITGDPALPYAVMEEMSTSGAATPATPSNLPSTGEDGLPLAALLGAVAGAAALLLGVAVRPAHVALARTLRRR